MATQKLTDDDDLDPGLRGPESVDALAGVDAGVVVVGVAHLQHVLVLAVPHPRYVVDRVAILGKDKSYHIQGDTSSRFLGFVDIKK